MLSGKGLFKPFLTMKLTLICGFEVSLKILVFLLLDIGVFSHAPSRLSILWNYRRKLFLLVPTIFIYTNKQCWKEVRIDGRLPLLLSGAEAPIILEILNRHFLGLRDMLDVSGSEGIIGWA